MAKRAWQREDCFRCSQRDGCLHALLELGGAHRPMPTRQQGAAQDARIYSSRVRRLRERAARGLLISAPLLKRSVVAELPGSTCYSRVIFSNQAARAGQRARLRDDY